MKSVQEHFPNAVVYQGNTAPPQRTYIKPEHPVRITWSFDLMVINVSRNQIVEQKAVVSDFAFSPWENYPVPQADMNSPKYWQPVGGNEVSDPYAQIDITTEIPACNVTLVSATTMMTDIDHRDLRGCDEQ